ncbi:MAG: hypothetical protein EOO77_34065 [Oxalobacteraceae bacterium]|nr:MAG: hypothetical protein EOO77_34065 [Oxalobacteraceae bacterium]
MTYKIMATYYFRLAGPERERVGVEADDLAGARTAAVKYIGQYLSEHPEFANEGHWQLNVENASGQSLVHIIVAMVVPRDVPADTS